MAGIGDGDGWEIEYDDDWESYLTGRTDVVPGTEETRVKQETLETDLSRFRRREGVRFRGMSAHELQSNGRQEDESPIMDACRESRYESCRSDPYRGSGADSRRGTRSETPSSRSGRSLYTDRRFRVTEDGTALEEERESPDFTHRRNQKDERTSSEVDRLSDLLKDQRLEMQALKQQLTLAVQAQTEGCTPVDKIFLESLAPMEYDGSQDFDDYLNQFEGTSQFLSWTDSKRAASLFGRLKGRALTCVASCPDRRYATMVRRLRDRFSPIDEEMYHQRLTTYRKKPDETWEDLAQKIETLALKAYRGMEEKFRESMAAKAFVEAVVEPSIRRRLRQKHPSNLNEAVRVARMMEADRLKEEQWQEYRREEKAKYGERKTEKSRTVEEEQVNATQARTDPQDRGAQKSKTGTDKRKFKKSPKTITCYFCKMVGHIQRNCPFKLMMGGAGGTSFTLPPGFPQFQLPALPGATGSELQQPAITRAPTQPENSRGQNQLPAALVNLPSNPQ